MSHILNELDKIDVLVIGAGNAGLTAAISAREYAKNVFVVEKSKKSLRGGNSSLTMNFRFAHNSIDELLELVDNNEANQQNLSRLQKHYKSYMASKFYEDLIQISNHRAETNLCKTLSEQSLETIQWMTKKGHKWEIKPHILSGSLPIRIQGGGASLQDRNFEIAENMGIHILYETELLTLNLNNNKIDSLDLLYKKKSVRTISPKAIILACGSYEANPSLRKKYLGNEWEDVQLRGVPFNTGDGIVAAENIGILKNGDYAACHATPQADDLDDFIYPGLNKESQSNSRYAFNYGISVNINGKRFFDEGENLPNYLYAKVGESIIKQPESIAFQLFDSKTARFLPDSYFNSGRHIKCNDWSQLADYLKINKNNLIKTIEKFNASIKPKQINLSRLDGVFTDNLDITKSNWAVRLDTPPFYGFRVRPGVTFTYGGLKINNNANLIHKNNYPVPNLFACGEIVGGIFFENYIGGSGLMSGSVFGRIAGRNAAKWAKSSITN